MDVRIECRTLRQLQYINVVQWHGKREIAWTAGPPCSWCSLKVNKSTFFVRRLYEMADSQQGRFWQSKYKSEYGVICAAFNCSNYTGTTTNVSWHRLSVKDEQRWEISVKISAHLVVTKMHWVWFVKMSDRLVSRVHVPTRLFSFFVNIAYYKLFYYNGNVLPIIILLLYYYENWVAYTNYR